MNESGPWPSHDGHSTSAGELRQPTDLAHGYARGRGCLQADSRTEQADPVLRDIGGQVLVGEGAQGFGGSVCHTLDHARAH